MSSAKEVLKQLKDNDVRYVDFRFTDPRGTWEHLAYRTEALSESDLEEGLMFDGSSIAGWKAINESDMRLVPDLSRVITDPFAAQSMAVIFCDVHEPATGQIYERDPRGVTRKALAYLQASGVGDAAYFGAEPEFFVFDSARFDVRENRSFFEILSDEGPYMSGHDYEEGNLGHRPLPKGGYFPVPPVDGASDLRAEMTEVLAEMGVDAEKHHHEVAPSQHELGMRFSSLLEAADNVQIYKYVVKNVAHQYGKTATFMPKPVFGDNGSGMHVHMSIAKDGKNLFSGEGYAGLSEMALHCIGGVIRHARALNALTNPITNSYKRLVPGYEAPVLLAYSGRNRSASIRIPYSEDPKGARIEMRFPDAACNPYLSFAALLMAGLDGIRNKIHPGDAMDKNLYDLPPAELEDVATVAPSLALALDALEADHDFLTAGDVFSEDQIGAYLELRREEVRALELAPHPLEFQMYYSV